MPPLAQLFDDEKPLMDNDSESGGGGNGRNGDRRQRPKYEYLGSATTATILDGPDCGCDLDLCTAIYNYDAQGDDELSLKRGQVVEVLSKDIKISGAFQKAVSSKLYLIFI